MGEQKNAYARNNKKTQRKTAQEQNTNEKHEECNHITKKQQSRLLKYKKTRTLLKMAK
jgi:hypothetical protein